MPLWLLLIFVLGALGSITLALHLLGLSRVAPWTLDDARAAWERQFPDTPPLDIRLAHNGRAALVQHAEGTGLVWQFGIDSTARELSGIQLSPSKDGLRIKFNEFAVPSVTLKLTEDEKPHWMKELQANDG